MSYRREYVAQVQEVKAVRDGDTFRLRIDLGWQAEVKIELRLDACDTAEVHRGSPFERRIGAQAAVYSEGWLRASMAGGPVWLRSTGPDPSEPEGGFSRWLGELWADDGAVLAEELVAAQFATVWPTRWHEVYDPERNKT